MILVTGSNGQLGSELKRLYQNSEAVFLDRDSCDITDLDSLKKIVEMYSITGIINCAAYTDVDKAESEKEMAFSINSFGVKNLAQISKDRSLKFIHISTDYVFDGDKRSAYKETDTPNPKTIYGHSKLEGEREIQKIGGTAAIIRTSWLYSKFGNNFVKTMIKLSSKEQISVVNDQFGSPTNVADLANAIKEIYPKIENNHVKLFHYSNLGKISWNDFAKEIFKIRGSNCKVEGISTKDYGAIAARPIESELNCDKIKKYFNLDIPCWSDSLKNFLKTVD